jgi:hypothetical protein
MPPAEGLGVSPNSIIPFPQDWGIKGGWRRIPSESSELRLGVPQHGQYDTMCLTRKRWGSPGVPWETGPHQVAAGDACTAVNLKEDV